MAKKVNKFQEHLLIPILWFFISASLVILGYLMFEYSKPVMELNHYAFSGLSDVSAYRCLLGIHTVLHAAIILFELGAIKLKKSGLYLVLLFLHLLLFFYFPMLLS
jgi:hypothetical protein